MIYNIRRQENRILVVEGPDNAGKTTLAQYLAKKLKAIYIKGEYVGSTEQEVSQFHQWVLGSPRQRMVILDRHPTISDPIYAKAVRQDGTLITTRFAVECAVDLNVIYCSVPISVLLAGLHEREQMVGVVENIQAVHEAYEYWYRVASNLGGVPYQSIRLYDYTKHAASDIVSMWEQMHRERIQLNGKLED